MVAACSAGGIPAVLNDCHFLWTVKRHGGKGNVFEWEVGAFIMYTYTVMNSR